MIFFENILLNTIYILFPLFSYLLYVAYTKNVSKERKNLVFDIALFSALYLVIRYGNDCAIVLLNIPLLLAYLKGRQITPIIMSIVIIYYYVLVTNFNVYFVFFEYALYYIIYSFMRRDRLTKTFLINMIVFIKTAIFSFEMFYILYPEQLFLDTFIKVFSLMIVLYIASHIILNLLETGEQIIDLNTTLRELEKEKGLRASLFKITHEIKNPIAVCKGYLDMLDTKNQDKVDKYIPIVKREISRTLTLMDDFLDYTKMKMHKEEIDIYMLIEDTCESLESLFKEHNVKTEFIYPEDELYINGDYNRLKQVLINLLKNAIEAKNNDDDLVIKLRTKELKTKIKITIEDNGVGMDDECLVKVTEMFYTTKTHGSGLGVGLSKEIIELHNGNIKYDSVLGKGTSVTITLPINN